MREKKGIESQRQLHKGQIVGIASKLYRDKIIYKKKKNVEIYLTSKDELLVEVGHDDETHKLKVVVSFSIPDLVINDVQCEMVAYPHKECVQAISSLRIMIGKSVQPGIIKETMKSVKNNGCTHLNNLFQEACYSVFQGLGAFSSQELKRLFPGITPEQITKIFVTFRPELIDSCVSFSRESSFMKILEKTPFPPGIGVLRQGQGRTSHRRSVGDSGA